MAGPETDHAGLGAYFLVKGRMIVLSPDSNTLHFNEALIFFGFSLSL